jgi:hypothetical protein
MPRKGRGRPLGHLEPILEALRRYRQGLEDDFVAELAAEASAAWSCSIGPYEGHPSFDTKASHCPRRSFRCRAQRLTAVVRAHPFR